MLKGTKMLTLEEALAAFEKGDGYSSIYGSSMISDQFMIENKVYDEPVNVNKSIDPSFTKAMMK